MENMIDGAGGKNDLPFANAIGKWRVVFHAMQSMQCNSSNKYAQHIYAE